MKTLLELKEEHSHVMRSADDVFHEAEQQARDLNDEEEARVAELLDTAGKLKTQIEARERQEALRSRVSTGLDELNQPEKRISLPTQPANEGQLETASHIPKIEFARYGKLNGFANTPEGHEKAYRCGMWLRARLFRDGHAKRWCKEHGVGLRSQKEADPIYGGNLVPDEMSQSIIDLRDQYGLARQHCTVMPMGRDLMSIPKIAGSLAAVFVNEEGTITEDEMSWVNINLVAKKAGVLVKVSSEVAEDAVVNLADIISTDMARAFALKEDECLFIGDGTSTYGGVQGWETVLNETNASAGVFAPGAGDDTFGELVLADIHSTMALLPEYARANAKFWVSATGWELTFSRLMAAAGGNTTMTLADKIVPAFLGYPVIFCSLLHNAATAQTDGLPLFLFGDMRLSSMIGDRRGFALKVSSERYIETDQIALVATTRFDVVNHGGGTSSAAGPMVACRANAS
jgi:HK97 family phage major capsid protein